MLKKSWASLINDQDCEIILSNDNDKFDTNIVLTIKYDFGRKYYRSEPVPSHVYMWYKVDRYYHQNVYLINFLQYLNLFVFIAKEKTRKILQTEEWTMLTNEMNQNVLF